MAKAIGYVPTSVSSKIKGNNYSKSGAVYAKQNLRDQGYPDSRGSYTTTTKKATTTTSSRPKTTTTKTSSTPSYSASYSQPSYSSSSNDYDYDYEREREYERQQAAAESYNALLAAYKKQQDEYEAYLRQRKEAAQNAYNKGMTALNSAYDSQVNSLGSNLSQTKSQLENQYNRSKQNITDDAANSLKQAYINKMQNEKNLGMQMSAMGLTGGATETTLANMLNNYGNARNEINTTQNRNLSNLEGSYSDNVSQAQQAYNSALANANAQKSQQVMALENALANNEAAALSDYQSLLQKDNQNYIDLLKSAIANGASFKYDPTNANNPIQAVAYTQANSNPTVQNNLAALQALMNGQGTNGTANNGLTYLNSAANGNALADFIKYLQGA